MNRENPSDALLFRVFDIKRGKAEEKKLRIIEATIDSIATRGWDQTTFDSIGKTVKMQRTHVNYYFTSRDELLKTTVRYAVAVGQQIIIDHLASARGWRDRLTACIEGPFEWLERFPNHAAVTTIFYHYSFSQPEHRAVQARIRQGGEDRFVACLEEPVEKGQLSRKKAVELARSLQSLLTGALINRFTCDYPIPPAALRKLTVKHSFLLVDAELEKH